MNTVNRVCLVDLDGTLADFDGAMTAMLKTLGGPSDARDYDDPAVWDLPHITARRRLIKSQPGFWRNLAPLARGFQLLHLALELDCEVHVLTKGPVSTTNAWTEKVEWCKEHLPPEVKITITQEKSLVYGRILIDDWPAYFEPWLVRRPRGLVVCPAQRWNESYAQPHSQIYRYEGSSQREHVRALMTAAIHGQLLDRKGDTP
jgi:5'-nucleotidase